MLRRGNTFYALRIPSLRGAKWGPLTRKCCIISAGTERKRNLETKREERGEGDESAINSASPAVNAPTV